ncbi:hypothetical protein D3C72_2332500 [compost metagenome]
MPGFDPDAWLDRLKATGGNLWFTMDPTFPKDSARMNEFIDLFEEGYETEAKRAAIFKAMVLREARKIASGTAHIRDKEAV